VVGHDLLSQYKVGLQQRLRGALHRDAGQAAHLTQLCGEGSELLVIGGTHRPSLSLTSAHGHGARGR
jgi:hypothetical protein